VLEEAAVGCCKFSSPMRSIYSLRPQRFTATRTNMVRALGYSQSGTLQTSGKILNAQILSSDAWPRPRYHGLRLRSASPAQTKDRLETTCGYAHNNNNIYLVGTPRRGSCTESHA
jgi:hypothetical protein